jgi:2-dehydro-3-deoxyphosphogalactonate aldolase
MKTLTATLAACPLVAILRGLTVADAEPVLEALIEAGFTIAEIPLNRPGALEAIDLAARKYGDRLLIGAGTVLTVENVDSVKAAGGRLIVSPNFDAGVVARTKAQDLISLPGIFTATEAFAALKAGADGLKLFPAEGAPPTVFKALKTVLPPGVPLLAVGGVTPENSPAYRAAGADGAGLGSNLYAPDKPISEIKAAATAYVSAWRD